MVSETYQYNKTIILLTLVVYDHWTDLDRGHGRQRRRENGVLCPCMDMPRHFDAIFTSSLTSASSI